MVRVTVPIRGRSYDLLRWLGHDRVDRVTPAGAPGRIGRLRRGRPDGLRRVVRAARVIVGRGWTWDESRSSCPRARRPRRCRCTRRCCISSPRRRPTGTTRWSRWEAERWGVSPASSPRHTCAACRSSKCRPRWLSQVDAAIGGKSGVNLPEGKNLVGTFSQPRLVIADVDTLAYLVRARVPLGTRGGGEVRSHAGPRAPRHAGARPRAILARDPATLERLVARCVSAKARTVAEMSATTALACS